MRVLGGLLVLILLLFGGLWFVSPGQIPVWDETRSQIRGYIATLGLPSVGDGASTTTDNIVRVGSPGGGYVDAPTQPVKVAANEPINEIVQIGSPGGRYVDAPAAAPAQPKETMTDIARIGSPAGRYVDAATAAQPQDATMDVAHVGSPAGRYVDAPATATQPTESLTDVARVGSPAGRYVDAAAAPPTEAMTDVARVGSPAGRYVDASSAATAQPKEAMTDVARVGSPAGRYVDAPAAAPTQPKETMVDVARVGSPAGRYVDAPAQTASASESGDTIAFPIKFRTAKNTFTTSGQKAADDLLEYVLKEEFTTITLTGHTDERGEPNDNLALSKRRLDAVADHLREGGYRFQILLEPKGESQPFDKVDRTALTERELWEVDRRVELRDAR